MDQDYLDRLLRSAEKRCRQGDNAACSYLHLIDLKRAGHSPTRTELDIPEGHTPRAINPRPERRSFVPSNAGSLVD